MDCLEEKQAQNIVVLDVRALCSYTDYIVVASGSSDRHISAMAEGLLQRLREEGVRPLGCEGLRSTQWALIDWSDVVVHLFHGSVREYYDIEGLWYNAPRLTMKQQSSGPIPVAPLDSRS